MNLLQKPVLAVLSAIAVAGAVAIKLVGGPIAPPITSLLQSLVTSRTVQVLAVLYVVCFIGLVLSHRAQTWLIYLHWIRPPIWLHRPDDVQKHGLSGIARSVQAGHLRGWHIKPPGSPFPITDEDYKKMLCAPNTRIIIFFHGNSGTRAFPTKRIRVVSTLAAQFHAHVFSFDYTGYGDTPGRPNEDQLCADARTVYAYVRSLTSANSTIIIYGQSLGSFWAVDLAKHLSLIRQRDNADTRNIAIILESAPSSLFDATKSHPTASPLRIIPGIDRILRAVLKEKLDSAEKMQHITFPILVMHGGSDQMISPDQGQKLFDRARDAGNENVTLQMFQKCGHNNVCSDPRYLATVNQFLDAHAPR